MKSRKEKSGLHLFDRQTGVHILFDEIKYNEETLDLAPRTVSLALTNKCNLSCEYCYNIKTNDEIDINYLKKLVRKLDDLGCLELTIGGGEPLIYSNLLEFCKWTWQNTKLGINITTNGTLLDKEKVEVLKSNTSSIRVSLNSIKNNMVLKNIDYTKNYINLGLNTIFFPDKENDLIEVIEYAIRKNIKNILIIPLHKDGEFLLKENDWSKLEKIIKFYQNKIELFITYDSEKYLKINTLKTEEIGENLFLNISAKKEIKRNSFDKTGVLIDSLDSLEEIFLKIKRGRI